MKRRSAIIVTFTATWFTLSSLQAQTPAPKKNPKVIETPINIIELDNSNMPATAEPKTIFKCTRGTKTVYVDNPKKPGLHNCQSINQKELLKFQPKPSGVSNNSNEVTTSSNTYKNTQQTRVRRPVDRTIRPNTSSNNTVTSQNSSTSTITSNYRPPCTGVITYKGKTYLLPNDKPCPIPDVTLEQVPTVLTD